ncbi:IS1380 family transposase [Nodosilinea sp. LEGE 07088]|nr:IS1380 family transposase [Nodosilinea sp. LEGE 07088]
MTFGSLERRPIVAEFNGGEISSDAGLLLIRQIDQHYGFSEQIAACFTDHRAPSRVEHSLEAMVAQRLYGLVQGYEDLNDHEVLRADRMLGIAVGKLERRHGEGAPLAGKSTLNRFEQSYRREDSAAVNPRYVKTTVDPVALEAVLLRLFFAQHSRPPKRLILDMDVTDDPTYGEQEGASFNGYYQSTCYTPLYIFCGRQLLVARLRPANVDPAAGALDELQRIIPAIQAQ